MEEPPETVCPLCGNRVRPFFLNLSERLIMCENVTCDFPFGYEELQIITKNSEQKETVVTTSGGSLKTEKSAEQKLALKMRRKKRKLEKKKQKNLETIKKLNEQLNRLNNEGCNIQKNEWLDKLMRLQSSSGRQLLTQSEMDELKKQQTDLGKVDSKINITTIPKTDGLINIKIDKEENELIKNDCGDTQGKKKQIPQAEEIGDMNENVHSEGQGENDIIKNNEPNKQTIQVTNKEE